MLQWRLDLVRAAALNLLSQPTRDSRGYTCSLAFITLGEPTPSFKQGLELNNAASAQRHRPPLI